MYHIKPYLQERKFNIAGLAKEMGMSPQRFNHHLLPKEDLSLNFISNLAQIINVPVFELIDRVKVPQKEVVE
jgi:antitoxin component HigA of HigAB toxin-antitoxin module